MNETMLKQLRAITGKTQQQLGDAAEVSKQYIQQVENSEKLMSGKTAAKMAKTLGVDADTLFTAHNLQAVKNRVEAGSITADKAYSDLAHILRYVDSSPNVSGDAEQVILQAAKSLADQLMATPRTTMNDRLGRDSLGLSRKGKAGGVRPGYANDFSAEDPSGISGQGRPESAAVADPTSRSLVDAVASLRDRIESGEVEGAGVLSVAGTILNAHDSAGLPDDADTRRALAELKQLVSDATAGISLDRDSGPGLKPSTASKGRQDMNAALGRGPGGLKVNKRFGA